MKKIIYSGVFFCLFFIFSPSVEAHVLKVDNHIGVIIHVSPDDDPIAGKESNFFFEFKDKQGKFSPEKCDCIIAISSSGKILLTQALFAYNSDPSLSDASLTYTFPAKGIYQVIITGKPTSQHTFTPFHLTYDIRVDKTISSENTSSSSWVSGYVPYLSAGIIACGFLTSFLLLRKKRT